MSVTHTLIIIAAVITVIAAVTLMLALPTQPVKGQASTVTPDGIRLTLTYETVSVGHLGDKLERIMRSYQELREQGIGPEYEYIPHWDAVVIKVTINLTNSGSEVIYYRTNAYCVPYEPAMAGGEELPPFTNKVVEPVTVPIVRAEEGKALPLTIMCTADDRFTSIAPGSSIVSEYYIIVSKDFKGVIKATASICHRPSLPCETISTTVKVDLTV